MIHTITRRHMAAFRLLSTTMLLTVAAGCYPSGVEPSVDQFLPRGPFVGQGDPPEAPRVFAPGFISTGLYVRDVAMSPDGRELYFGVLAGGLSLIAVTRQDDAGRWTRPEVAPFSADPRFFNLEPHISPDGNRFFFLSTRPPHGGEAGEEEMRAWVNQDIWVMEKTSDGWSEPRNLGPPVNSDRPEFFPSTTRDGTLYFTREPDESGASYIYRSRLVDGAYAEAERLPEQVNAAAAQYNAFIDPDERYLVFSTAGLPDTQGGSDYYVAFRSDDDTWTDPITLGVPVNSSLAEFSPYVSPDGRAFFFMSTRRLATDELPQTLTMAWTDSLWTAPRNGNSDIYWMDAAFIEALRPADP